MHMPGAWRYTGPSGKPAETDSACQQSHAAGADKSHLIWRQCCLLPCRASSSLDASGAWPPDQLACLQIVVAIVVPEQVVLSDRDAKDVCLTESLAAGNGAHLAMPQVRTADMRRAAVLVLKTVNDLQVEPRIMQGPQADLQSFMKALDRLEAAIAFLLQHRSVPATCKGSPVGAVLLTALS